MSASTREIRVLLLVDDEDHHLLRRNLRTEILGGPVALHRARDEAEAFAFLGASPHDALIVDHVPGTRDGVAFLRRARERGFGMPAILLAEAGEGGAEGVALHEEAVLVYPRHHLASCGIGNAVRSAVDRARTREEARRPVGPSAVPASAALTDPAPLAGALPDGARPAGAPAAGAPPATTPRSHAPLTLDLNALARSFEKEIRMVLGEGVTLEWAMAPGSIPAFVDPTDAGLALLDLCANARDAMPGGGTLTVGTGEEIVPGGTSPETGAPAPGAYAFLEIRDTSVGMSPETRNRVLRVLDVGTTEAGFLSKGLGGVLRSARRCGGGLRFESEPGTGTACRLLLPRADPAAAVAQEKPPTVLLVEAERDVVRLAEATLRIRGYEVLTAADPAEALRVSRAAPGSIALLVSGVAPGGEDGRALVRTVREERPGIRVLYVTGAGDDPTLRSSLESEGVALLRKPYTPRALVSRVRAAIEGAP